MTATSTVTPPGTAQDDLRGDTVLAALARAVDAVPDSPFLDFDSDVLTYRETAQQVTRLAHALADLGIGPGDAVVTQLDNNADLLLLLFATNTIGAVWVPVNTAYRGEFLRHQVADSAATVAVCEADYLPRMAEVAGGTALTRILVRGAAGDLSGAGIPVESLDAHRGTDDTPITVDARPGDLSCLIYTSGTTGPSKGCMFPHNFLCNQGRQLAIMTSMGPDDVAFTCLPLFHTSALNLVASTLLRHGRVAVTSRFSASRFWADIERSGATTALLMASIFPWVAHAPDTEEMKRCFGQLRMVTGVPVSPEVRTIWKERFGVGHVNTFGYGQSEGVLLAYSPQSDPAPPTSCGHIAEQDFDVRILDDEDREVAEGETGEIAFRPKRPDIMFSGYWRRPEDTVAVWRNLWMHTGDLGRIENGYLFFVDRKKDYLRSRGENISSFEVERTFLGHPAISEAAVHSVDTGIAEDSMKATLVLKDGHSVTVEELCRWSIDQLPHFAVPRFYEFRAELARTPNGRIMKYQLRQEGVTETTWDREVAGISVRRR